MEDTTKAAAPSPKEEFRLKEPGNLLTLYKVGKKAKYLNHSVS